MFCVALLRWLYCSQRMTPQRSVTLMRTTWTLLMKLHLRLCILGFERKHVTTRVITFSQPREQCVLVNIKIPPKTQI